ncbi:hypothetical protein, partial [Bradyrhizobium sp.]|uniref:hypothetical protein n=1 Tax=Bradyrhizobium sp. TaxID=376 RepID=UPI0027343C80
GNRQRGRHAFPGIEIGEGSFGVLLRKGMTRNQNRRARSQKSPPQAARHQPHKANSIFCSLQGLLSVALVREASVSRRKPDQTEPLAPNTTVP